MIRDRQPYQIGKLDIEHRIETVGRSGEADRIVTYCNAGSGGGKTSGNEIAHNIRIPHNGCNILHRISDRFFQSIGQIGTTVRPLGSQIEELQHKGDEYELAHCVVIDGSKGPTLGHYTYHKHTERVGGRLERIWHLCTVYSAVAGPVRIHRSHRVFCILDSAIIGGCGSEHILSRIAYHRFIGSQHIHIQIQIQQPAIHHSINYKVVAVKIRDIHIVCSSGHPGYVGWIHRKLQHRLEDRTWGL